MTIKTNAEDLRDFLKDVRPILPPAPTPSEKLRRAEIVDGAAEELTEAGYDQESALRIANLVVNYLESRWGIK